MANIVALNLHFEVTPLCHILKVLWKSGPLSVLEASSWKRIVCAIKHYIVGPRNALDPKRRRPLTGFYYAAEETRSAGHLERQSKAPPDEHLGPIMWFIRLDWPSSTEWWSPTSPNSSSLVSMWCKKWIWTRQNPVCSLNLFRKNEINHIPFILRLIFAELSEAFPSGTIFFLEQFPCCREILFLIKSGVQKDSKKKCSWIWEKFIEVLHMGSKSSHAFSGSASWLTRKKKGRFLQYMECTLSLDTIEEKLDCECLKLSTEEDTDYNLKQQVSNVCSCLAVRAWFGMEPLSAEIEVVHVLPPSLPWPHSTSPPFWLYHNSVLFCLEDPRR